MQPIFEEIDFQQTPLGDISLRRRSEPRLDNIIIYEVKLNEEFLMSSLFTEAEIQLSILGLNNVLNTFPDNKNLNIIVGGLGLGYTAATVLENSAVSSLNVIDVMQPVINWHKEKLVPLGERLISDPRCKLTHADFYGLAKLKNCGFDSSQPNQLAHAVLLDIDHSPGHLLNDSNASFYTKDGLENLTNKLYPKGIFGLWSNELPDKDFIRLLDSVFESTHAHIIKFPNPYTQKEAINTVYLSNTY
ncbi:MAG: spermidine synthase [Gammaproteobacteria bacterium]|nr:spermidine synthase [Gammaproteobacteria bacterium]